MVVTNEINDEIYEALINYAFQKCDAVMFVVRRDIYINDIRIDKIGLNELKQNMKKYTNICKNYLLKLKHSSKRIYSRSLADDEMFDVYFYKFSNTVKELLLENRSFYSWLHPNYPEDIAFFKNGYCWLWSIAHEEICKIECESREEYEYLKSIGIKFFEKDFEPTPKKYLYYEDYGLNNIKSNESEI